MMTDTDLAFPWRESYDTNVPFTPDYQPEGLCAILDRTAHKHPTKTAYIFGPARLSFGELQTRAEIMAANLRGHGLNAGDRVSLMFPNMPQQIIAFWGVLKAGGIVVMTNPAYMETELVHHLRDAEVRMLLTVDSCWPKLEQLRDRLPVEKYFVTSVSDALPFSAGLAYRYKTRKTRAAVPYNETDVFHFKSLLKGTVRHSTSVANPQEELAIIQYTGGTTGLPKGVCLTHANLSLNAAQLLAVLNANSKDEHTFVAVLPIFHVYGLCLCVTIPVFMGATTVLVSRYDPGDLLRLIARHKVTLFPGAPSIYLSLMQHKDLKKYDLSSLKYAISGSAPISAEALQRFKELTGCTIVEGYGLTECSPITHLNPMGGTHRFGSIGLPLPGTEAKIVDMEVGAITLPPGKPGELIIRGPQVMRGYYKQPDETAGTLRNGWLYTGDIAHMDEQGFFYIDDRKKDMVIVGGYNVFPREIDDVLLEHPDIKEAVAVAVPHPTRGERLKVYVVPKEGASLTASDIVAYCRQKLATYKVPRQVEFRESLPRAMTGKILRRALRAEEIERYKNNPGAALLPDEATGSEDAASGKKK